MAELPFPGQDETLQPEVPQAPKGTGLRRVVVAVCAITVCLGLAAIVLFGTRTAHRFGKRTATTPAEAAPRPANTGDPLKGLQTDYAALLTKTPTQTPAAAPTPQAPAQTAPAPPPQKPPKPQKDQGMLVLEGKQLTAQQQPAVPRDTQDMPQMPQTEEPQPQQPGPVERNRAFLKQAEGLRETRVQDTLHDPESPWMILAGDVIPATLVTGIQSDLPGELVARVRQDVRDSVEGRTVLIPQGTMLLGTYNNDVVYGQGRVLVVWHRLRLPNGQTMQLQGMPGIDLSGYAGLKDKVDNHLWPLFRAVLLTSVLSIGTRVPFGSPDGVWPTLSQEFTQEFAHGANQAGQQIVRRELNRPPTIAIRPGMSFHVFVVKDLVLQPYTGAVARKP
jgi:type IV secretion system protein VirB10